jgi:hypothetical protein
MSGVVHMSPVLRRERESRSVLIDTIAMSDGDPKLLKADAAWWALEDLNL